MITRYRKNQRKIAMGLLSFHQNLKEQQHLLKELDTYEEDNNYQLFCYYHEGESANVQGLIGISIENDNEIVLQDISLNPSYRGERIGFQMLDELQFLFPGQKILATKTTADFLSHWHESKKEATNE
ncbi:GNAT family N-acetyltransferase [Enterococcus sp. AZ103]|uniref:GNAT family N-acetyltransferase n=1 Tax=Enterococcus sp. AZ103 TaxID=2774628 RepID=UPI003F28F5B2